MTDADSDNSCPFEEIFPPDTSEKREAYVDAVVGVVEAKACRNLVQTLSNEFPLTRDPCACDLSHLKRVKRSALTEDASSCKGMPEELAEETKKRKRENGDFKLVVLGTVDALRTHYHGSSAEDFLTKLKTDLKLADVSRIRLPAHPPESKAQWEEFHAVWPTTFHPNKTKEFRAKKLLLSQNEIAQMTFGLNEAISDAKQSKLGVGTVIVSPQTEKVVARSSDELELQGSDLPSQNPLATSIVLAIQAVSRMERALAVRQGMDNADFQSGQYLCTDYDVYTTREPSVYEAMALVHSRIRRLVFGLSMDAVLGGLTEAGVQSLPGTNHKYRVFRSALWSDLTTQCRSLHKASPKTEPSSVCKEIQSSVEQMDCLSG